MKNFTQHLLFILLLITFSFETMSQTYSITTSTDSYTALPTTNLLDESNPDSLGPAPYTYAVYQAIPIGFDFDYYGESFDSLRMTEDGFATFWNNAARKGFISIFDCDLDNLAGNPALSPIYYSLEGTPGSQIFKCEIVNSGFTDDMTDTLFTNFQLWLYENCSDFEVRIGQSSTTSDVFWTSYTAPVIGYGSYLTTDHAMLIGDPTNPTLQQDALSSMTESPAEGMVYSFSNCTADLASNSKQLSAIYPNPAETSVTIELNEQKTYTELTIQNLQGAEIKRIELENSSSLEVDLEEIPAGVYFILLRSEKDIETHRVLKL